MRGLEGKDLTPLFKPGPVRMAGPLFCGIPHPRSRSKLLPSERSVRSDRFKLIESLLPDTIHPDYEITIDKHETYFEQLAKNLIYVI